MFALFGIFMFVAVYAAEVPLQVNAEQPVAFINVNVVSMLDENILSGQTVLISDGQIQLIDDVEAVFIGDEFEVIDGEGGYLSPGLSDMHTHLGGEVGVSGGIGEKQVMVYLANGVTTILNQGDFLSPFGSGLISIRDRIIANELPGPTIYTASYARGPKDGGASGQTPRTFEEGVEHVTKSINAGYDFIKIYNDTQAAAINGIFSEAAAQNISVTGHFPNTISPVEVLNKGMVMVAHSAAYYWTLFNFRNNASLIDDAIDMTVTNQVYVNTTLKIEETIADIWGGDSVAFNSFINQAEMRYAHPLEIQVWRDGATGNRWNPSGSIPGQLDAGRDFVRGYIKDFFDADIKLVLGTDSPTVLGAPGFSTHDELDSIKRLGLSNFETLATSTKNSGEFILQNVANSEVFGIVAEGARADFILSENNPLEDINVLRTRLGVMARGNWYSTEFLQTEIEKIAISYESLANSNSDTSGGSSSGGGGGSFTYWWLAILFGLCLSSLVWFKRTD